MHSNVHHIYCFGPISKITLLLLSGVQGSEYKVDKYEMVADVVVGAMRKQAAEQPGMVLYPTKPDP
jgi:hypothetical protein